MISLITTLIACHFVGDFPFQGDFLGLNKGKSWEINFYHAITYTATFVIFAKVSLFFALFLLVTHFFIDPLKARYHYIKHIWVDQLLHMVVILIGVLFFYGQNAWK